MGKPEDEQNLPSSELVAQGPNPGAGDCNWCCLFCSRVVKLVSCRCVFVLVLGVAVLLSAVFWLPFFHFGDHKDLDLDYGGHDIVASFTLNKSAPFLEDHMSQLEDDIFEEMSFTTTKVEVISLESSAGSNITKVVFSVESDATSQSLIRASFVYLITRQSSLHLTESLFGDPSSFNVLKFRGGITVSPVQKAFLMQNVQILFNFTLNFSIDLLLTNFEELTSQLNKGLQLSPYENLYVRLTNLKGSTVAPPTTVQSQVLLAVGINPSNSRLKQLAQTITGSHSKNLGLNNTVFGRVKQIQLSSILQHSLGSDGSSPSPSPSPSQPPLPLPRPPHRLPHHRHGATLVPAIAPLLSPRNGGYVIGKRSPTPAPVPAPMPGKKKAAEPPACHFRYRNWFPWKHNKHSGTAPSMPPAHAPHAASPQPKENPSTPSSNPVSASSPLPNVGSAHSQPPSKGVFHGRQQSAMPLFSPSPSPSCAGIFSPNTLALPLFISLGLLL
ncbi:uncharacterized protein [Henckelia pumila]|uniref:uncharacterized protein n=1 Tax=Henckelia pumila TaxID=405737 RepID=UPI003C6E3334